MTDVIRTDHFEIRRVSPSHLYQASSLEICKSKVEKKFSFRLIFCNSKKTSMHVQHGSPGGVASLAVPQPVVG